MAYRIEPDGKFPKSPTGNPLSKFVNLWQSPEERRGKYYLLRSIGLSVAKARQARDFRISAIERIWSKELGLSNEQRKGSNSQG